MKKTIAMLCASLMLFTSITSMAVGADDAMPPEKATQIIDFYTDLYGKPPYFLGDDGVFYADSDREDYEFPEYITPQGTYDRTDLLKALCCQNPDGKFAIKLICEGDNVQKANEVERLKEKGIEAVVKNNDIHSKNMLFAVMTAAQLDNFPVNEKIGYKMALSEPLGDNILVTEPTTEPEYILYGDANCDGTVNILDVIFMNKHLLGLVEMNEEQKKRSDCNCDNFFDGSDTLLILKEVLEISDEEILKYKEQFNLRI